MKNSAPGSKLPAELERLAERRAAGGFVVEPLTPDGSDRVYFRIRPENGEPFIAVDGRGTGSRSRFVSAAGVSQNQTFFLIRDHLEKLGFPVPGLLGREISGDFYLLEDLGDATLCDVVQSSRPEMAVDLYRKALSLLARLQVEAAPGFDPAWAYGGGYYDRRVIRELELDYFFEAFVCGWAGKKNPEAGTLRLREEFAKITEAALQAPAEFFLYRDFQSRNLMVRNEKLYLIDFQGARLGPVYYDAASLIEDPYVELPRRLRDELVEFYYGELAGRFGPRLPAPAEFHHFYDLFTLIRTLQALGAFGFFCSRGKSHFAASIPPALKNLETVLERLAPNFPLPELTRLTGRLSSS